MKNGYVTVYLPLDKEVDAPFHIQGHDRLITFVYILHPLLYWHYMCVSESTFKTKTATTTKFGLSAAGEKKIRSFLDFDYDLYYFVKKHFYETVGSLTMPSE